MFAIIFFRLWFLQVLSGSSTSPRRSVNRVRDVAIPAPRGEILDSQRQRAGRSRPGARRPDRAARPAGAGHHGQPLRAPTAADAAVFGRLAQRAGDVDQARAAARSRGQGRRCAWRRSRCDVAQQQSRILPVRRRDDQDRRLDDVQYYIAERQNAVPRGQRRSRSTCATTRSTTWPRSCSARSGRSTPRRSRRPQLQGRLAERDRRPVRARGLYDRYLRGTDGRERSRSTRSASSSGYLSRAAAGRRATT